MNSKKTNNISRLQLNNSRNNLNIFNIRNPIYNSSNPGFNQAYLTLNQETDNLLARKNITRVNNFYTVNYNGEEFLFTWKNIVNKKDIELLKFANTVRKMYVDGLRDLIVYYFESECSNHSSTSYNEFCRINAMGSTALTSNYNVNVSSFLLSTDIVSKFNKYFFSFWKDTSGEIFDTNFYGNSFFVTIEHSINYNNSLNSLYNRLKSGDKNIFYLPPHTDIFNSSPVKKQIFSDQISWLVLKIYLYHHEFQEYVTENSRNNLNTEQNITKKLGIILNRVKKIILKKISNSFNEDKLKSKYVELEEEKLFRKNQDSNNQDSNNQCSNNQCSNSQDPNIHRKKLDELYVTKLVKIDEYQKEYMSSKNINNEKRNNLLVNLFEAISTSNFFGNETYFCVGTIYHVLGYIQGLGEFHMYEEFYIQSMIENFIDTFRYVEYVVKDKGKFILKASKYIFRVYDAIIRYKKMKNSLNNNSEIIKQLKIKQRLFGNIRAFYQNDPTKPLSQKFVINLRNFYNNPQLTNNNSFNSNLIGSNSLNKDDIIKILSIIVQDISSC
jgi:hypothetical protein